MSRGLLAAGAGALAAAMLAVILLTGGEDKSRAVADPLAAAAAYIHRDTPIVAVVDSGDPQLRSLLDRFPGADFAIDAIDPPLPAAVLRAQLGNPVVIGSEPRAGTWTAAFVPQEPDRLRDYTLPRLTMDGDVAIIAATPALAKAAIAVKQAGSGTQKKVTGTSVWVSAGAVRESLPDVGVGAARIDVDPDEQGLIVKLDAAVTDPQLLPIAIGPQPPRPAGEGAVTLALRDPKPALRALLRDERARQFDGVRTALRRFLRADLDKLVLDRLTGTATVTLDGDNATIRAPLTDGRGLRSALGRAAKVPGFVLDIAGVGGYDLAAADGRFVFTRDGLPLFALGVENDVLVVSTDAAIDIKRIAARRSRGVAGDGAAWLRVTRDEIVRRVLDQFGLPQLAAIGLEPLGDLTLSLHAERDRVTGTGRLAIAQ